MLSLSAIVKQGKIIVDNLHGLEGESVRVTISKKKKHRSLDQNAWYWGAILPMIAHETGHTTEELHEIFKRMFLPAQEIVYREKVIRIPGSTATLSTMEFSEFVERVRTEAAQMSVLIPDPF